MQPKPNFALINVSDFQWLPEDLMEYIMHNEYFYSSKEEVYDKYCKQQHFCDCDGNVFMIVGRTLPTQWWKYIFRFLPGIYRQTLHFEHVGSMSLEELKAYIIAQISRFDDTKWWVENVSEAKTYYEVIHGH